MTREFECDNCMENFETQKENHECPNCGTDAVTEVVRELDHEDDTLSV